MDLANAPAAIGLAAAILISASLAARFAVPAAWTSGVRAHRGRLPR
jgi:hypothetical protein